MGNRHQYGDTHSQGHNAEGNLNPCAPNTQAIQNATATVLRQPIEHKVLFGYHDCNNEVTIGKQVRPDLHRQPGVLPFHQGLKSVKM
jgi:hypothetical protein